MLLPSEFIQLTNPGLKPGFFAEIRVGFLSLKTRVNRVLYFYKFCEIVPYCGNFHGNWKYLVTNSIKEGFLLGISLFFPTCHGTREIKLLIIYFLIAIFHFHPNVIVCVLFKLR